MATEAAYPPRAPLRVVYLSNSIAMGGMERHIADLSTGMAARGHTVLVIVPASAGLDTWANDMARAGLSVARLSLFSEMGALALASNGTRLARRLRQFRPHLVHQHRTGPYHGKWACVAARAVGVPVVVATEHQPAFALHEWPKRVNRWLDKLVDAFVTVSDADRREQLRHTDRPADKVLTIHNGVDMSRYRPPTPQHKREARARLGLPADAPVIGMTARLHAQKGIVHFLRAVPLMLPDHPDLVAVIAGDGPERAALIQHAAELGISAHVRFLGYRSDVAEVLTTFDVCAVPSEWESLGIAAIEAQAAGLPVVASNVGGLPEVVVDGHTGYLVPPQNPPALAEALHRCLADPAARQRMGVAARQRAESMFSLDVMLTAEESLYRRLLGNRRRVGAN